MIDRDLLRSCIAYEDGELIDRPDVPDTTAYILGAARLVADPDTLTISKVDGEWPESVLRGLLSRKQMLDALLEGQKEDTMTDQDTIRTADPTTAEGLVELAWGLIANAGWDGLEKTEGWQEAAVRWRDHYHAYLDARETTEEQ